MGCCSSCGFSACRCDDSLTIIADSKVDQLLIPSLTCVVDQLRDIEVQLGARTLRVSLVWTQWSGGERGLGVEETVREEVLTPYPKVAPFTDHRADLQAIGTEELGQLMVTDISARYTEDFLQGHGEAGEDIQADQSFYWEIRTTQVAGSGMRRRYVPNSPPSYDPLKFGWAIKLLRASEDRTRDGDTRG